MTVTTTKRLLGICFLCTGAALVALGCGDELDDTLDCGNVCDTYSDCVTNIDVTACTDSCEDRADADPNVEAQLEICDSCVEDQACAEIEGCWADCPVVAVAD